MATPGNGTAEVILTVGMGCPGSTSLLVICYTFCVQRAPSLHQNLPICDPKSSVYLDTLLYTSHPQCLDPCVYGALARDQRLVPHMLILEPLVFGSHSSFPRKWSLRWHHLTASHVRCCMCLVHYVYCIICLASWLAQQQTPHRSPHEISAAGTQLSQPRPSPMCHRTQQIHSTLKVSNRYWFSHVIHIILTVC